MKKCFALILVLAFVLPLAACGGGALPTQTAVTAGTAQTGEETAAASATEDAGPHDPTGFAVGFSRKIITPTSPTPMAGYGNNMTRVYKRVLDDITLSAIAFSDGENKVLLITQDLQRAYQSFTEYTREMLARKLDFDYDKIIIAATHTHSSVDMTSDDGSVTRWKSLYYKQILAACREALADLDRVTSVETAAIKTEGMTFVRRYFLKDGTHIGDNSGTTATTENPVVAHESVGDEDLQLIRIKRANQKEIILGNFQGHPHKTGGSTKYDLSADYIHPFRKYVEEGTGAWCAFFLGASGNMNTTSRIKSEAFIADYIAYGKKLAQYAIEALETTAAASTGTIHTTRVDYEGIRRHSQDHLLSIANKVNDLFNSSKKEEAMTLAKENGLNHYYEARAIISNAAAPATQVMELYGFAFGNIAFITAPYEMFANVQLELKERSPFAMTFFVTCCQQMDGYFPTLDVIPNGGYEVYAMRFEYGTAEILRDRHAEILEKLYDEIQND